VFALVLPTAGAVVGVALAVAGAGMVEKRCPLIRRGQCVVVG
jgi:hypothetical protein